jgi:hypothetical protein
VTSGRAAVARPSVRAQHWRAADAGKQLGGKQEVAPCSQIDFKILMEVPLIKISKLLLKVPKKLKICKNKSCSKIQDLQLSR